MRLVVLHQGKASKEFDLAPGSYLIGRWDPDSGAFPEIDLEAFDLDAKVSRKHAVLEYNDGLVTLTDLGSLNGTFVNRGPRLEEGKPVELKIGDELIVGKVFLNLEA